ncbi:cytochrome P450 [Aspergillus alliaceus]|uniref:cytochrome P450 n=1 Tax=Petromyces alliaceus TaxID=209559 RepID=UPI0012A3DFB9|nr:putative cytochrome P450 [Aspergillus alliaceus]KAB8229431.1 putative cytochrome P450 [Aspergillus alliaceus]
MLGSTSRSFFSSGQQDIAAGEWTQFHYLVYLPIILLFAWRLWAFTISPRLYQGQLEYLPYWIPYIGHVIPFYRNSNALFALAKKQFNRKLCTLRVVGEDIVMVTTAAQIATVEKDTQTFGFEPFLDLMYDEVAKVSRDSKSILWQTRAEGFVSHSSKPRQLTLAHSGVALLHKQLLQADPMHRLMTNTLPYLSKTLQWDSFYETSVLASAANVKVISLDRLSRDVIMDAQTSAFLGPRLLELEPDFRTILKWWDTNSWKVWYKLPPFLAKSATCPRDRLIDVMLQYYSIPAEQRPGCVPFVNEVYDEYKHAGLPDKDIAGIVVTILWGLNSNVHLLSYWMIAHLMNNPTVVGQIREEIAPMMMSIDFSFSRNGSSLAECTKDHLLKSCPIFNSTFNETLRFTATGSSLRQAMRDTILDGRRIPKGTSLIIPQRVQTMNEAVFGPDYKAFDCYRFLRNKSVLRKADFRGFGGGATMCSGRYVGKHAVLSFLAILFWRYDLEMVKLEQDVLGVQGKHFPRLDETKPSLGPGHPMYGDDMFLKVTPRKP